MGYKVLLREREERGAITVQKWIRRHLAIHKLRHLKREKAVTILQAHWRGRVNRNQFLNKRKKAIVIQSYFRMWIALKKFNLIQGQRHSSAVLIQTWVRRFLAGKEYEKLKQEKQEGIQYKAAEVIQTAWRNYKVQLAVKKRLLDSHLKLSASAIMIQKHWRGHKDRIQFLRLKSILEAKKKEHYSAIII